MQDSGGFAAYYLEVEDQTQNSLPVGVIQFYVATDISTTNIYVSGPGGCQGPSEAKCSNPLQPSSHLGPAASAAPTPPRGYLECFE